MTAPTFDEILAAYDRLVYSRARRYHHAFRQVHDLDDLVQEARIGLWQAYEACTNWTTFPAFARRVIDNRLYRYCNGYNHLIRIPDHAMRRGATPHETVEWGDESIMASCHDDIDLIVSVRMTLDRMPANQARNLWAVCALGWTQAAYARHIGQHERTIKDSVRRARATFRRLWGDAA